MLHPENGRIEEKFPVERAAELMDSLAWYLLFRPIAGLNEGPIADFLRLLPDFMERFRARVRADCVTPAARRVPAEVRQAFIQHRQRGETNFVHARRATNQTPLELLLPGAPLQIEPHELPLAARAPKLGADELRLAAVRGAVGWRRDLLDVARSEHGV